MVSTYRHWIDGHYEGTEHEELDKRAVDLLHRASQVKAPHWQTFNTSALLIASKCPYFQNMIVFMKRVHILKTCICIL